MGQILYNSKKNVIIQHECYDTAEFLLTLRKYFTYLRPNEDTAYSRPAFGAGHLPELRPE